MSCVIWDEVWGSHIVTAVAQTQKHNYWGRASCVLKLLQTHSLCASFSLSLCLCTASNDLRKCFVACAGPEDTILIHIACSSYKILWSLSLFFFFKWRHTSHTWGRSHLPVIVDFHFLGASIWFGLYVGRRDEERIREKKEKERELLIFFESVSAEALSAF